MPSVAAPRARRSFARLKKSLDVPNLLDIQRRSFDWLVDPEAGGLRETIDDISPIEDYTGHLAVQFGDFHFDEPRRVHRRVPREGPHVLAPADGHGRLHQPRDRRDPRAVGLHGRLPVDDRARHLHHQRHRAGRRHPARALPGRVPDGAEGPREAGLHGEPHAGPRLVARARDRQEGQGLRPHRPQAQAAGHGPPARDDLQPRDRLERRRGGRGDRAPGPGAARPVRQQPLPAQHRRVRPGQHEDEEGRAHRALQEAAPGRAAQRRRRVRAAPAALLRSQALRPHARRALQAELAPEPGHRPRRPDPHARRHPRARARAHQPPEDPRHPRGRRGRDQGLRGRGRRPCRASRSPTTSTSTSTSATAACARSASSSRRPSASACTGWSASSASASRPRTRTRSRRRRS